MIKKIGLILLLICPILMSWADPKPLLPDQAFNFSAQLNPNNTLSLNWQIADKHYLYKDHFSFKILQPKNVTLGTISYPSAQTKHDDILGTYQVYTGALNILIPILNANKETVVLQVNYQGCSEDGYCYPPITHEITANFAQNTIKTDAVQATLPSDDDVKLKHLFAEKHFIMLFLGFIGFGLLLAFTPCVLPMIPILSGIILGHGHHISHWKAFRLSLVYVLSMSITYAVAGLLIGYLGGTLQATFQKPWVIILFSIIFVLMALSMFGLYNLQPPQKFEAYIAKISGHQKQGSYIGVAIMGCLATLIISPCVTPALVAALGYVSQKGDMWQGAAALFATGLGMGIPLLLIGISTKLVPHTGHWMTTVKSIVGVLLLAMAILMLSRILPGAIIMLLWALLLIGCAIYLGALTNGSKKGWANLWRGIGLALLIYGVILIIGAAMNHTDPLKPFTAKTISTLPFQKIKTTDDLNHALALAKSQNKPVMLDFYADWCISCKEMERTTFSDEQIKLKLNDFMLLRADVTANDQSDKILMQKFNVIAPPTLIFFNSQGQELKTLEIVGAVGATKLLQTLDQVNKN